MDFHPKEGYFLSVYMKLKTQLSQIPLRAINTKSLIREEISFLDSSGYQWSRLIPMVKCQTCAGPTTGGMSRLLHWVPLLLIILPPLPLTCQLLVTDPTLCRCASFSLTDHVHSLNLSRFCLCFCCCSQRDFSSPSFLSALYPGTLVLSVYFSY